ncbi:MAG TPA: hypothetical protein VN227_01975, partial [Methanoregula sp.]|nr:hypothetical protein [Methanoregula sp.]
MDGTIPSDDVPTDSASLSDGVTKVSTIPPESVTRVSTLSSEGVTRDRNVPSKATIQPNPGSNKKWFVIILVGLIVVFGLLVAAYYFTHDEHMGVTVIRMEGTMVTGQVSDADTIGSEVIGRELRNAADDPMVEAIVLR